MYPLPRKVTSHSLWCRNNGKDGTDPACGIIAGGAEGQRLGAKAIEPWTMAAVTAEGSGGTNLPTDKSRLAGRKP